MSFTNAEVKVSHMPISREELATFKSDFYKLAGFPEIMGCVDGSHIPIIAPRKDKFVCVVCKGFHSINIQAVYVANLIFHDIVAKWPVPSSLSMAMVSLACSICKLTSNYSKVNNGNSLCIKKDYFKMR